MSKGKYLLLALLCVGMVLTVAPAFAATQTVKSWNFATTNPGWDLTGDWTWGIPTGSGGDADGVGSDPTGSAGNNVLGTNLDGNYAPDTDETATSGTVDCTGNVGTKLTFVAWLDVQDSLHDQATLEVSNDGGDSWEEVFINSPDANTIDTSFVSHQVDISEVADGNEILIRFRIVSNSDDVVFGGWNVKSVLIEAAADDTPFQWLMGATNDVTGVWTLDPAWQVGTPVAGGGEVTPDGTVGADPTLAPDGTATSLILGYNIGGNYERDITVPKYATTPGLDFSDKRALTLSFSRWLAVEDGRYDHAAVQINNDDETANEVLNEKFSGGLGDWAVSDPVLVTVNDSAQLQLSGNSAATLSIDTSNLYSLTISARMGADITNAGTIKLRWTADGGDTWNDLPGFVVSATQSATAIPVVSIPAGPAENNPDNFKIRALMTGTNADLGFVDNILIEAVTWQDIWTNPVGPNEDGSRADVFDTKWAAQKFGLADFDVDGAEDLVRIRWAMGPTDDFTPTPPQVGTEYGGWSIAQIKIAEGTFAWLGVGTDIPVYMTWESGGDANFDAKNYGTGYWDDAFAMRLVQTPTTATPALTDRWGVNKVSVEDTVDAGATTTFDFGVTAPPISTFQYLVPAPTNLAADPTDPKTSNLNVVGAMQQGSAWLGLYNNLDTKTTLPNKNIVIGRFTDIDLATPETGAWARFWIEELAGRVPRIVQGFPEPDGTATYRSTMSVSRGTMCAYIARSMGIEPADPDKAVFKGTFRDVTKDTPFWYDIEAVQQAGVVQGFPPDFTTFQPDTITTRDQMAKFIANGAGVPVVVVPASIDPADFPFDDVPILVPGTTDREPFVDYIAALKDAEIVQGYEDSTEPQGQTYRPGNEITRDQLAVYIWRAFMRPSGAAVILAGPAITDNDPSSVTYNGWQSVSEADEWDVENTLYVQWDAMRLKTDMVFVPSGSNWDVKFELRDSGEATAPAYRTWLFPMTAGQITTAVNAAKADGDPYLTMFQLIPQEGVTYPVMHGDFTFVVSERDRTGTWFEALRQPGYMAFGLFKTVGFFNTSANWTTIEGTPAKPVFSVPTTGLGDLSDYGATAIKFAQEGSLFVDGAGIDTSGWQDLVVHAVVLPIFLSADDSFVIEFSTDGGVTWETGENASFSDVAEISADDLPDAEATEIEFSLPAQANDNPNFQFRIVLSASSLDAVVYLTDLFIKGL